jgi:tetratricopeptide (TPR) repeat protein
MVKHDIDYSYFRRARLKLISDWAPTLIVFIGSLSLYIKTMAPSLYWGDQSAFASTGPIYGPDAAMPFPLYASIIRLVSHIPGFPPAFMANLISSLFSAVAVMFFFLIVKRLSDIHVFQRNFRDLPGYQKLAEINPNLEETGKRINIDTISRAALTAIPTMTATTLFALTLPVWLTAVHAGVFSLQLALTLMAIFLAIDGTRSDNVKHLLTGVWLYALTFTCYPVVALALAPAFLYLIIRRLMSSNRKLAILASVIVLFAVCLSVFAYLPIHFLPDSAQYSGSGENGETLLGSLPLLSNLQSAPTGGLAAECFIRLKKIVFFIADEIGWVALGLFFFGLWGTFLSSKKIFPFFPLALLGYLAILVWMGRFDIRNYELIGFPAVLISLIIIVVTIGLLYLLRLQLQAAPSSIYVAICLLPLVYAAGHDNYKVANLSEFNAPAIMSEAILNDIPEKSLIFVEDENLSLPLMQFCSEELQDKEIIIISSDALPSSDYRGWLKACYPQLIYPGNFDLSQGEPLENIVAELCRFNSVHRNIYVQYSIPGINFSDIEPFGVMYKYSPDYRSTVMDDYEYRNHLEMAERVITHNSFDPMAVKIIGKWLYGAGLYYENRGDTRTAWKLFSRALTIDQQSTEIRVLLADNLAREGRYKRALKLIADAMKIDSDDRTIMDLSTRIEKELSSHEDIAANDE